jgi:hypothetical protein
MIWEEIKLYIATILFIYWMKPWKRSREEI